MENMRRQSLFRAHDKPFDRRTLALFLILGSLIAIKVGGGQLASTLHNVTGAKPSVQTVWPHKMPTSPAVSEARRAFLQRKIMPIYGALPLRFEANQGQVDERVKFLARGTGYTLFLTDHDAVLSLRSSQSPVARGQLQKATDNGPRTTDVLRLELVGANPASRVDGLHELPGKSNYLIGGERKKWHKNVPSYAEVRYQDIYPGLDLVYHGKQRELEYDYVVAPGADPGRINLRLLGARRLSLDSAGNVVVQVEGGEVLLKKPHAYQESGGRMEDVPARYMLVGTDQVGLRVAPYARDRALVIDPVLSYATYLGGSSGDSANGIAVDASGNAYVTGYTQSADFPTLNPLPAPHNALQGSVDAFVTKLNAAGTALVYSTYLGGTSTDVGNSIAVDSSGSAYVAGYTYSADFPTMNPLPAPHNALQGNRDAFVTKLDPTGSALVYSTYLGGSGFDYGYGIAVDSSGNAYVTGYTQSTDFPTLNPLPAPNNAWQGSTDAFVTKLNAAGNALVYSTYLGGTNIDLANSIAVDSSGSAYVTGYTYSADFPTLNPLPAPNNALQGSIDAFVTKLNAAGNALVYSTFLGGMNTELGNSIAVDSSGSAYVTGYTFSADFPTLNPLPAPNNALQGNQDAFVTKLNAAGNALVYSTFLGGTSNDVGTSIAVDSSGNAYVVGQTPSGDFPKANSLEGYSGSKDTFVAELDPTGATLLFSSYLGGAGDEGGNGIALDTSGNIYVTGSTSSNDFPATIGAFQTTGGSSGKAFVAKISPANAPGFSLTSTSLTFPDQSVTTTSNPQAVRLRNMGSAPLNISNLTVSGDFAQTNTCGGLVSGGSSCTLGVTFAPTARGSRTGTITFSDDAAGSPQTISLTGSGISPAVTLSTNTLTFPAEPLNATSPAQTVTLTNSGLDPLTINGIVGAGDFAETNTCSSTLAVGANCTVTVTFIPTRAGTRTGTLRVVDNAAGGPQLVQLTGTGTGPDVMLSSAGLIFDQQPVGTSSGAQVVTVTNDGNAPLSIIGITTSGYFTQTNNCGTGLAAQASCTINVIFSPTSSGTTFGAISIADNAPGNPHVITLSGTAVAGPAPEAFLSNSTPDFGQQLAKTTSSAKSLTLANTGNAALSITGITISGDFAQTNTCGSSVAAGANCTISVTFSPQAAGAQAATVTVSDNAHGSPHSTIVIGTGIDFGMAASPASSTVTAGQSATYTVALVPVAGFNQSLALTCSGAPQTATCTLSSGTVTLDGTHSSAVTVTLATTARSILSPRLRSPRGGWRMPGPRMIWPWLVALLALLMLVLSLTSRRRIRPALMALVVLLCALLWSACVVGAQHITGTPAGSYALTITGTAGTTGSTLSHSLIVGLTVN